MEWIPAILTLVLGAGILIWLLVLHSRVSRLTDEAQSLPTRSIVPGQPNNQRWQRDLEGLQHQIVELNRDFRILERRISEIPVAGRGTYANSREDRLFAPTDAVSFEARTTQAATVALETDPSAGFEGELLKAFNELASSFDPNLRDAFVDKYQPVDVAFEGGYFSTQEGGKFWLIDVPTAGRAAIVPTGKIAREWDKLYRAMNGMQAQSVFGEVFDIAAGGQLKITAVAKSEMLAAGGALLQKGGMSGI